MKSTNALILGLLIGLTIGVLVGMNVGKGQPIWSNPFSEMDLQDKIRQESGALLEKSGQILESKGAKLKKKFGD